jgi:hypothetical protein
MYFPLTDEEIDRLRRFGVARHYAPGDYLVHAGEAGLGMFVILSGYVNVTRRDGLGHDLPIISYRPRYFLAEVGQLSGRASFVDARAVNEVEAIAIPPEGLRGLVIAEAELGERIMRALILRRVGLIEAGAGGPVLIGPPDNPGLMRLQNFLARNGIPYRVLDPAVEHEADGLLACVNPSRADLPLVCARTAAPCATRPSTSWPNPSAFCPASTANACTMWRWSARGRRAWPPRFTPPRKACRWWCWRRGRSAARRGPRPGSRITSASPPASPARPSPAAPSSRRRNSAPRW